MLKNEVFEEYGFNDDCFAISDAHVKKNCNCKLAVIPQIRSMISDIYVHPFYLIKKLIFKLYKNT